MVLTYFDKALSFPGTFCRANLITLKSSAVVWRWWWRSGGIYSLLAAVNSSRAAVPLFLCYRRRALLIMSMESAGIAELLTRLAISKKDK